jgi:hypothetical protein
MKKLPEVDVSFDHFYGILIAPIKSRLLLTGIEDLWRKRNVTFKRS